LKLCGSALLPDASSGSTAVNLACRFSYILASAKQEEEIVMILAPEEYRGKSAMGIAIGSSDKAVLDQYRTPSRTLDMTQGESWVYDEYGISFQIRKGKVVSWLLF
jgi:predicted 3-demethylubiquinone-9 3-methyltransferase (glyoxalase superfamily)